MKRYLPLLFLALLLAGGIFAWRYHHLTAPDEILSAPDNAAPPTREPNPDPAVPQPTSPLASPPENVSKAFVAFLAAEAASVESPQIDADLAQKRMLEQAGKMGEEEIKYTRDLVLNDQNAADLRILGAYMLGLAGAKGRTACREITLQPTNSARAEPHSVAELKNTQNKSLGGICIDALFEQAKTDPSAREELVRWAKDAKDSTIQKLLAQRVRELPPL